MKLETAFLVTMRYIFGK